MDDALIQQIVEEALNETALSTARLTDGMQSKVYSVALADREIILRLHADPRQFSSTQRNLEALAGLGLPVPQVLAADLTLTRQPFAYLILTKLSGRDLRHELSRMTEPQMTHLAEQIVEFQSRVTKLPSGTGYGYVGLGEQGPKTSWWDVLLAESGWDVMRTGVGGSQEETDDLISEWQERARVLIHKYEPHLRSVPPTCFLDDITVKNVLIARGELQGLIDFDCVCYGDPLFWLGLTAVGVVCDVGTRELFYVNELCRLWSLNDEACRIFRLYSVWIGLSFLARPPVDQTQEWRARMLSLIEERVMELENSTIL